MRISIIVAVATNGVIGHSNALPWNLASDLRRFKRLTMSHHLVVGRRTWESIGRALPGRRMIVISRSTPTLPVGVQATGGLDEAIALAVAAGDDELFVAGGAAIYALALPVADRLYLNRIHADIDGDVYFPELDLDDWVKVASKALSLTRSSPTIGAERDTSALASGLSGDTLGMLTTQSPAQGPSVSSTAGVVGSDLSELGICYVPESLAALFRSGTADRTDACRCRPRRAAERECRSG
ncbi:MAG: dihydrofolate reductase [Acidobacteria bacterium]|nr:dihydrofolate reductase [Acidobacteriota bacterium]